LVVVVCALDLLAEKEGLLWLFSVSLRMHALSLGDRRAAARVCLAFRLWAVRGPVPYGFKSIYFMIKKRPLKDGLFLMAEKNTAKEG
jgi:hypothetical protein